MLFIGSIAWHVIVMETVAGKASAVHLAHPWVFIYTGLNTQERRDA